MWPLKASDHLYHSGSMGVETQAWQLWMESEWKERVVCIFWRNLVIKGSEEFKGELAPITG